MAVTAEQLLAMMSESMAKMQLAVAALAESQAKSGREGGGPRRALDLKHRSIPQFEGGSGGQFDDWAFAFKRMVRAANKEVYDMMVLAESGETMEEIADEVEYDKGDVAKCSAKIYDLLCQAVKGDPLQLIKSVDDMEGLKAWYKLTGKYSPKSMARAVRLVGQVTNPTKIGDLNKAETELDKWEELVKILKKDFNESFSDTVKLGIVATMMPASVQELIYQSIGKTANYEEVIQKVRAVVSNKVAMMAGSGPSPMDVGEVRYGEDRRAWEENYAHQEDEVGAVNFNAQCYRCSGWGHLGRDCPTAKGMGKGGKSSGKGGKDGGKGYKGFKGGKDVGKGGKGFRGACYTCGKTGHRANECYARQANMVDGEEDKHDGQEQEIGGLWTIGAVESIWQKPKKTVKPPPGLKGVTTEMKDQKGENRNKFKVLEDDFGAIDVMAVDAAKPLTRMSAIEFHVADVRKPLASAAKMVRAGNRIVLDEAGSYIMNKATGETMEVTTIKDTFVFDVQFENGELDSITLDSGAGVHVWPKEKLPKVPLLPKQDGLKMMAANGSEIKNYGRKLIKFRGNDCNRKQVEEQVFSRRV